MVPAPPPPPARFPCWCRAVYSWGGESKRDLGFIEGDLIECLNAGDGSWWVGRLYRDRRTIGSFPSNFVEVLPQGFRPTARSVSPLPSRDSSASKNVPIKSKTFRKPFEAYAKAPHYTSAKQPETFREPPQHHRSHDALVAVYSKGSRNELSHAPSPPRLNHDDSGVSSPSRRPSRLASQDDADSPPPPPPPHRHVGRQGSHDMRPPDVSRHGSTASYGQGHYSQESSDADQMASHVSRQPSYTAFDDRPYEYRPQTPRPVTPGRLSPAGSHMTPSPLREAMDGVMEQLDQLGGRPGQNESPEGQFDPWSPESFNMVSSRATARGAAETSRPLTSMGIANLDEGYETWSGQSSRGTSHHAKQRSEQVSELPRLSNYVERMEKQFEKLHQHSMPSMSAKDRETMAPPPRPPRGRHQDRPKTSSGETVMQGPRVRLHKSAYEIGRGISRTGTTKTTVTNASTGNQSNTSSSTQSSGRTLWSGASASGFSSTSAGSLARTTQRAQSALAMRGSELERPETPFTGVTYHSSHGSHVASPVSQPGLEEELTVGLGGLVHPKAPKRNIFKKIFESAKTGVASNRNSIATGSGVGTSSARSSPFGRSLAQNKPPICKAAGMEDGAREMGAGRGVDWVQVRRDVNRSNSLSRIEKNERLERCQMMDHAALNPVDELYESMQGDESLQGTAVAEPVNYQSINLSQVDKNSRFICEPPPMTTAISLATSYICRPFRSEVQRLRAIFTWVSEKISWEEDFEGEIDTRRVIQTRRGCGEEYAVLVMEMCAAVGVDCEVVRGYLKSPGDVADLGMVPRSNHWWNAVVVDNEWRIMDCCLASPSNPKRSLYSSASNNTADAWWFLLRPSQACWTHVPEHHEQQHIVPPVAHEILLNLPCACPAFFRSGIEMVDYNTSAVRIEDLEMVHIKFNVPPDVEIAAEVEARAYSRDTDGDLFENGDVVKKRALAQAEWYNGVKRYTVKALLPGDESHATLNVYSGKRGLMHSIKDIPHPLAFALPLVHTGENPPYDFVTRHPTPHAQRHDIYVVQPQCQRLALNNTFVFAIRQHPSSLAGDAQSTLTPASNPGATSPVPFMRPSSAMSQAASSVSASNPSCTSGTVAGKKPAKLAIQTPGGKILRLMRKEERRGIGVASKGLAGADEQVSDGGTWETIIKCSERGIWRGLVLADRTARWCVFAEWTCV
ncbi:hypothetical protein CDD81_3595 [Ophiocordyceps australis]|uniref:SH3 domain-containing protein n=1 Tax=Ophiocordyceps australis TaxID=1399860 RepID=A0A2C5XJK2_9HYPO|nr:hypothetical protein CDD81_3595 [Ophiocordyceps australis]